jgi:hypothetical protein
MLYDPKWEVKPLSVDDLLQLDRLAAWLEKQPPQAAYDYCDPMSCAAAQYLSQNGVTGLAVMVEFGIDPQPGDQHWLIYNVVGLSPYTFGAALERARALQAK